MNPNTIKTTAMDNFFQNIIPKEGETISYRGGLGNGIIYESKKENGLYYRRYDGVGDWEEFDLMREHLKVLQDMTDGLYRDFYNSQNKIGLIARLKKFLKRIRIR